MLRRSSAAFLLICIAAMALPLQAQVTPSVTHEVRRGDTLYAIAGKTRHEGVSRNQMILAIWRANPSAFPSGSIHLIEVGTVLSIPPRETVAAIASVEADREVRELLASKPAAPASAQVAATRPQDSATGTATAARSLEKAIRRFEEGLSLERQGDDRGALTAFLESGDAGYGLAQRKLGQIYDKGNSAVRRDFQASIYWYQKARAQGVELDRPISRTLPARVSD